MAISPPSDIVSDVARAADPARYQAAAQRLSEGTSPVEGTAFDDAMRLASSRATSAGTDVYTLRNSLRTDVETASVSRAKKAHEEFEAYVLQTFVESMLPKEAENTFGKGTAGSVWKSMMAEQISAQMAKAGGIGIAKHFLKVSGLGGAAGRTEASGLGRRE